MGKLEIWLICPCVGKDSIKADHFDPLCLSILLSAFWNRPLSSKNCTSLVQGLNEESLEWGRYRNYAPSPPHHLFFSYVIKNSTVSGAPGWLSGLSVRLRLGSRSHGWWVHAPHQALSWQIRTWSLLPVLCLPFSLPLSGSWSVSLSLSKVNKC